MSESDAQSLECARLLAAPPALPWLDRLAHRVVSLLYRLRGLQQYDDFRLEHVAGMPLLVTPRVFNPRLLRTGAFFASQIDGGLVRPEVEVLDMGTGSGVCALFAARHARRVIAMDINAAAVRCAQINALMNQLHTRLEVRHGDLFAAVAGERFDLVLFNPPFVRAAAAATASAPGARRTWPSASPPSCRHTSSPAAARWCCCPATATARASSGNSPSAASHSRPGRGVVTSASTW